MAHTQLSTRTKVSVGIAAVALVGLGSYSFALFLQDQSSLVGNGSSTVPVTELDTCFNKCLAAYTTCSEAPLADVDKCRVKHDDCRADCRATYTQAAIPALRTYEVQTASALPAARVGQTYSLTLSASNISNGVSVRWGLADGGRLPDGMRLYENGVVSGTPIEPGIFSFTARVESAEGSGNKTFTLVVSNVTTVITPGSTEIQDLAIYSTSPIPNAQRGQSYFYKLMAQPPRFPAELTVWTLVADRLPDGVRLDPMGYIQGVPVEQGSFTFTVRAQNTPASVGTKRLTLVVGAPTVVTPPPPEAVAPLTIATESSALPRGTVNQVYNAQLQAGARPDPNASIWWTIDANRLPDGVSLGNTTGALTGTPREAGSFTFTVRAQNGNYTATKVFTLVVATAPVVVTPPVVNQNLSISPSDLPVATLNQAMQVQLQVPGNTIALIWAMTQAEAVPGMTLSSSGLFSGTPSRAGTYTVFVSAEGKNDATRVNASRQYRFVVEAGRPVLSISASSPFPGGVVDQVYRHQPMAISGGVQPYVFRLDLDRLPNGLSLNQVNGAVEGTPTEAGTFSFTIRANDASGATVTNRYTLVVKPGLPKEEPVVPKVTDPVKDPVKDPVVISPVFSLVTINAFPNGTVGNSYSHRPMIVGGGRAPITWSVIGGSFPAGLSLDASGAVSGVPAAAKTYTFTLQAHDADGAKISSQFTMTVNPQPQYVQTYVSDPQWPTRVNLINDMGLRVHDLIKLADDGDADTQYDTTVYYIGADGRRHAFPNPKVYFSWFSDYAGVRIIMPRQLANIPLGANISYRPGVRLVKFITDPRVYAVDTQRRLRWVVSEQAARDLYGDYWARNVEDISDAFYMDYRFDAPSIRFRGDFDPNYVRYLVGYPSDVLP